jgi:hypothetical protein
MAQKIIQSRKAIMRTSKFVASILALFLLCGCPKIAQGQTSVTLGPDAIATFISSSGAPLANGYVCTYAAGTNTPQSTYTDSTGTVANANPTVLNSAGRANIWFTSAAYKIVVRDPGGDSACDSGGGTIEFTTDNFQAQPFLAGNNAWTGNQTFAGTSTFNGAVTFSAGGSMTGTITGSPTFSGNPTFSGSPTFSSSTNFSGGIKTDTITGTITTGGTLSMTGANGTGANNGEGLSQTAGIGGATGNGGGISYSAGGGGGTSGAGGSATFSAGSGAAGNGAGGSTSITSGSGQGTANAGNVTLQGGTGGATSGNGGNLILLPGSKGAGGLNGNVIFEQQGRIQYQVNATSAAPTCSSTGNTGGGTCTLANYSTDSSGMITLLGGSTASSTGTVTLTFNQTMGANGSFCIWTLHNGSGSWVATSSIIGSSYAAATASAIWTNGGSTSLVNAASYNIDYTCRGEI